RRGSAAGAPCTSIPSSLYFVYGGTLGSAGTRRPCASTIHSRRKGCTAGGGGALPRDSPAGPTRSNSVRALMFGLSSAIAPSVRPAGPVPVGLRLRGRVENGGAQAGTPYLLDRYERTAAASASDSFALHTMTEARRPLKCWLVATPNPIWTVFVICPMLPPPA